MNTALVDHYFQLCKEVGLLASLSFELTNACNFACTHCYRVQGHTFLRQEIFYKALTEAEEMGALFISFNGGEPTLHPKFLAFAQEVLHRGMHLTVLTNAYRITPDWLDALEPWAQNIHFQISLYGVDDASGFSITCVPDAHTRPLQNAIHAQARGFSVKIALLALQATSNQMEDLTHHLEQLQLPYDIMLFLSAREDGDRTPLRLAPDDSSLRKLLPLKPHLPSAVDERDPFQKTTNVSSELACSAGETGFAIRANGNILPCQVFYHWPIFGQQPDNSLQEAFVSLQRQEFLQQNRIPDACRTCKAQHVCLRCPAEVFNTTGEFMQVPETSCHTARIVYEWELKKSMSPP